VVTLAHPQLGLPLAAATLRENPDVSLSVVSCRGDPRSSRETMSMSQQHAVNNCFVGEESAGEQPCPFCLGGGDSGPRATSPGDPEDMSSGSSARRQMRRMKKQRRHGNRIGRWWKKYGYVGKPYCQVGGLLPPRGVARLATPGCSRIDDPGVAA
jgi:hypothetical protein